MALQLDFSNAEAQRLRITQEQQRKIQELYKQASAEIARQAGKAPRVPSDALRKSYLNTLQGQIDERLRDIEAQLNGTVRSGMTAVAAATVGDAKQFLQQNGLSIKGAYSHVPADIVNAVASGQLYSDNWTLSRALWLNTKETQQDVQNIVAQGIIQNKSAFEIAKDLERYVDPTAKKDWDWSKVYPGTRRVVDYNAQRLARTMVSHAYQQAFVRTTQKNPFVKKYRWEASNSERTCELCEERNGQLFDKDDLPLDHPNGMCTFTAVMDDMDTIGERLGDWAAGKDDPELDAWAKDIYGKGWEQKKEEIQSKQSNIVDGHNIADTWQRRPDKFAFGIEDVINAQGFDGLPRIVSADEFDRIVSDSSLFCQRVYGTEHSLEVLQEYQKQLYSGKWHVDCSSGGASFGRGMYCASSYTSQENKNVASTMVNYAGSTHSIVETLTLVNARTITDTELTNLINSTSEDIVSKFDGDRGAFAAAQGYDAITHCGRKEYIVVLNRTKCVFKEGANPQSFEEIRDHWLNFGG